MIKNSLLLIALFCATPVLADPVSGEKNTPKEPEKLSFGLTQEQIRFVHSRLEESLLKEGIVRDLTGFGRLNWDIVPLLLAIRDGKTRHELFGEKCWTEDSTVIYWLSLTKDPRIEDAFYQCFSEAISKKISCQADSSEITEIIQLIGGLGTKKSQDMLFSMLKKDFWAKNPKIQFDMPARPPNSAETENQYTVFSLRQNVLGALAHSGTDAALHAMATGEGIPEDLRKFLSSRPTLSLFDLAANRRVENEGYKIPMNKVLPEDTKLRLIEIYQTYGKTFVEAPVKNITIDVFPKKGCIDPKDIASTLNKVNNSLKK